MQAVGRRRGASQVSLCSSLARRSLIRINYLPESFSSLQSHGDDTQSGQTVFLGCVTVDTTRLERVVLVETRSTAHDSI